MLNFYGDTHPGCVEELNEDSIGWDAEQGVWLVADGMGGHAKGEVASRIAKETILSHVGREMPLAQSVLDAHRAVVEAADELGEPEGMGSTVVAVQLSAAGGDVVWVGDSRAYLWSGSTLRRLSRDHSFLELLLANKVVTPEEARRHPRRHLITRTLGMGEPVPDHVHIGLLKDDWLLLCSDGLNDELTDDEIADELRQSADPHDAVQKLISAALDRDAKDNVSVIIVECDETTHSESAIKERFILWKPIAFGVVAAMLVFMLLVVLGVS